MRAHREIANFRSGMSVPRQVHKNCVYFMQRHIEGVDMEDSTVIQRVLLEFGYAIKERFLVDAIFS